MGEKTTGKDHGDLGVVRWVKSQCHSFSREVVEDPVCKKGQNPVSPRADCPRNREEELTGEGSEPPRNGRFFWQNPCQWRNRTGRVRRRWKEGAWSPVALGNRGRGLLWNTHPGGLQPIDGVGLQSWNDGPQGGKVLQDPTFLWKERLETQEH